MKKDTIASGSRSDDFSSSTLALCFRVGCGDFYPSGFSWNCHTSLKLDVIRYKWMLSDWKYFIDEGSLCSSMFVICFSVVGLCYIYIRFAFN